MFPKYLGWEVRDLLCKLLERNPRRRLGAKRDFEEVKNHVWF